MIRRSSILFDDTSREPRKLLVPTQQGRLCLRVDRATGAFIRGYPVADTINWTKGLDSNGLPLAPRLSLSPGVEKLVCPGVFGARAGHVHSTYSPSTHWGTTPRMNLYVFDGVREAAERRIYFHCQQLPGHSGPQPRIRDRGFDPITCDRKWTFHTNSANVSSLLSTAGDLVFGGDLFGNAWGVGRDQRQESFGHSTRYRAYRVHPSVSGERASYVCGQGGLSYCASALAREILTRRKDEAAAGGSVLLSLRCRRLQPRAMTVTGVFAAYRWRRW